MTGKELKKIRKRLGVTQVQLADLVGVQSNSVARWERDERGISEPIARLILTLTPGRKVK